MSSLLPDTANLATLMSKRFRPNQIPDLSGRVALVTGGSAGIGYWDAAGLAHHNATVHIVSASPDHGKGAEADINTALKQSGSKGSVKWHQLDMMHIKKVDEWAKIFAKEVDRLDILIANAGIGQAPYGMTEDGLERHFEVNNLAHYVIVLRLLDLLKKTAASAPPTTVRIVMQSSEMHRFAPSGRLSSKEEINEPGDGVQLYGRTKLGLIVFASELARRKLADSPKPILSISVHPGMVDTDVQNQWSQSYGALGVVVDKLSRLGGKSAEEGAEASLWAATSTDINESKLLLAVRASITRSHMASQTRKPTKPKTRLSPITSGSCVLISPKSSSENAWSDGVWQGSMQDMYNEVNLCSKSFGEYHKESCTTREDE